MLGQILTNAPKWVWFLLAALLWLGISQRFTRTVSLRRSIVLPVVMTGLSLFGTISAFGYEVTALVVWLSAVASVAWWIGQRKLPDTTTYDSATQLFTVSGSWQPLILILSIFVLKFAVGTIRAIRPELATSSEFSVVIALLYGAMSGVFIGRAKRLWKLVQR